MRKTILLLTAAAAVVVAARSADKDPVLMTVAGEDVTLSEFEYLYHKNTEQQIEPETLDEYMERFIIYKLKVADARAAGIDTTKAFREEFIKYRNDLAEPYMTDSAKLEAMVEEIYDRKSREVEVAHIMLPIGATEAQSQENIARLDSIRTCVLNGEDFGDLAIKYSIDRAAKTNRGNQGFVTVGRFPEEFEKVSYETPIGQISAPFKTNYGYHIVWAISERPNPGEVLTQHILKLFPRQPRGGEVPDSLKAEARDKMQTIYTALLVGGDFDELAAAESDDRQTAENGGKLRWGNSSMFAPEISEAVFALEIGQFTEPIETDYGIHIFKKIDARGVGTLEECRASIIKQIEHGPNSRAARQSKIDQLRREHKLKFNDKLYSRLETQFEISPYDSLFVESMKRSETEAFTFAKNHKVPAKAVAERLDPKRTFKTPQEAAKYVRAVADQLASDSIVEYEKEAMRGTIPEYGNLVNEYYNGMLLYEISNKRVWNKANHDSEGMYRYFNQHKDNYKWDEPRFKGTIIYVTNDSIEQLVKEALSEMAPDTATTAIKNRFKRDIKIEKVVVVRGENEVADALAFGGDRPLSPHKRYHNYFLYEGRMVENPEEISDARGAVTTDYQNKLEEDWVAELKEKYPVKINEKVYKMIK